MSHSESSLVSSSVAIVVRTGLAVSVCGFVVLVVGVVRVCGGGSGGGFLLQMSLLSLLRFASMQTRHGWR